MQENDGKYIFGVVKIGDKGHDLKPGDTLLVLGDQRGIAQLKTNIFQQAIDQAKQYGYKGLFHKISLREMAKPPPRAMRRV